MNDCKKLIPWLTLVFITGILLCGCGNQASTSNNSEKTVPLPAFNAVQSKVMFRDVIEKLHDTDMGEYPGTNPNETMEEFGVYYIALHQRDLVKNRQVKLSDVQRVVKEYFDKEISQPVSTKRLKFDGNSFTLNPSGKEWIDQYDIQSIKQLPNDEYQIFATVAEKATTFNNFKSEVYLHIDAKFARRFVDGKERFFVLAYVAKAVKDNNTVNKDDERATTAVGYKKYINDRFGFSIDYPESFIAGNPPANGDGLSFTSPDKRTTLTVSGGNNSGPNGGTSLKEYLSMISKGKNANPVLGDNWFVISWKEDGKITYCKMFVGSSLQTSFRIAYPEDQKDQYDKIVSNLEKTFRPGKIDNAGGQNFHNNIEKNSADINNFLTAMAYIPKDAKYYGSIITPMLPQIFSPQVGRTNMLGNVEIIWSGYSFFRDRNDISKNPGRFGSPLNNNFVQEYEILFFSITLRNPTDLKSISQAAFQAALRIMSDRPDTMFTTNDGGVNAVWDNRRVMLISTNDFIGFVWRANP